MIINSVVTKLRYFIVQRKNIVHEMECILARIKSQSFVNFLSVLDINERIMCAKENNLPAVAMPKRSRAFGVSQTPEKRSQFVNMAVNVTYDVVHFLSVMKKNAPVHGHANAPTSDHRIAWRIPRASPRSFRSSMGSHVPACR